jgi:hypothetical protein
MTKRRRRKRKVFGRAKNRLAFWVPKRHRLLRELVEMGPIKMTVNNTMFVYMQHMGTWWDFSMEQNDWVSIKENYLFGGYIK